MKKKINIQPKMADIILAHNYGLLGWWVRVMTKSYWNHSLLYLGKGKVLDILGRGITILDYNRYYRNKIQHKIIRVKGLSDYKRKKICQHALKFVGKKYNLGLVFSISNKLGTFTCSQFLGKVFADKGIILAPELLTSSPADFDRSIKTYDINNPPNRQKEINNIVEIIKNVMTKHDIRLEEIIEKIKGENNERVVSDIRKE